MPYKNSRRQWVKLWVNEWLSGTVRFQLSAAQRSLWADMLALAGASRLPGIVASGETNGKPTPYPPGYLSSILRWDKRELQKALKLFVDQDRIKITDGVIYIVNWNKYQSEYQRQAKYRNKVTGEVTRRLPVEGEGEVEVEGEGEGDNPSAPAALPEWVPKEAWTDWAVMRQKIRKPLTPRAVKLAIRELDKLRGTGQDPKAVLEQSTFNSWQGLFELRVNGSGRLSFEQQKDEELKAAIARGSEMARQQGSRRT